MNKLSLFHEKVEQEEKRGGKPGGREKEGELQQLFILEQELQAEREKVTFLRDQLEQREIEILEHKGKQSGLLHVLGMQTPCCCIILYSL